MAKTTRRKTKTQSVRSRTADGKIALRGKLFGGSLGKLTYLALEGPDGTVDYLEGQRLYRLAKAVVTRFEAAR